MKTLLVTIIVSMFLTLFVTSQAYAPCIEGYGINCNGYPPHTLSQIHFDKLNYETQDKPVITVSGVPSTNVHLEIDDSSSNIMFEHDLNLSSNGTARYILDISYYKTGGYSATATSLMSKVTTGFTVGMMPSGGMMGLNVDKNSYLPGDQVSILGTGNSNTLIQLSLIDPYGTSIRSAKIFSDKTGHFSLSNFTIPNNAVSGIWQIGATGGIIHVRTQIVVNSTNNHYGINIDKEITPSPLKQLESGTDADQIKCNPGLQLIFKQENMSPICVKLDTAYMLIKRGWAFNESAYPKGDAQFALKTNSTIISGHLPRHSGIRIPYQESSRTINYTGFDGVYNVTLMFRGTPQDYVLKPGANGTITFEIEAKASELPGQNYPIPLPKSLNLTNYAVFYHEVTSIEDLSKYPGVTISDDYGFKTCFTRPGGGGTCQSGSFEGKSPIEAYVVDHPGVNVLFEPPSEVLPLGTNTTSQVVTMMLSADNDAPRGTYLVEIPNLGEFLLTVGSQPYHE